MIGWVRTERQKDGTPKNESENKQRKGGRAEPTESEGASDMAWNDGRVLRDLFFLTDEVVKDLRRNKKWLRVCRSRRMVGRGVGRRGSGTTGKTGKGGTSTRSKLIRLRHTELRKQARSERRTKTINAWNCSGRDTNKRRTG